MTRESQIETYTRREIERSGGRLVKLNATLYKGIPDRLAILPQGRVAFLEFKRPQGGRLSVKQAAWLRDLQELGQEALVLDTYQAADGWLHTALGPGPGELWLSALADGAGPLPDGRTGLFCLDHPDDEDSE